MAVELDFEDPFAAAPPTGAPAAAELDFEDPFAEAAPSVERPGILSRAASQLLTGEATELATAYATEINELRDYDNLPWYKKTKYPSDPAAREQRIAERLPELQKYAGLSAQYQREQGQATPEERAIAESKTLGGAFKAAAANPGAAFGLVAPSAMASMLDMPQTVAAGLTMGPRGAVAASGYSASRQDYKASVLEALGALGYDTQDSKTLQQALLKADALVAAQEQAKERAMVVGGAAGASTFLGGKMLAGAIKPGLGRELANVGLQIPAQAVIEGAGEAAAQQASGQEYKPGEIVAEMLGGAVTAPATVAQAAAAGFKESGPDPAVKAAADKTRADYLASVREVDDGEGGTTFVDAAGNSVGDTLDEVQLTASRLTPAEMQARLTPAAPAPAAAPAQPAPTPEATPAPAAQPAPASPLLRGKRQRVEPTIEPAAQTEPTDGIPRAPDADNAGGLGRAERLPDASVGATDSRPVGGGTDIGRVPDVGDGRGGDAGSVGAGNAPSPPMVAPGQPDAALESAAPRILYRGTSGSQERIQGGIVEGALFAAADEPTARLYGQNVERIAVKPDAKILVEGTPEFAKVTGRRLGKLINKMRRGENLKTAADDAAAKARAAGYDGIEFTSMKDMGVAIFNENAVVRNYTEQAAEQVAPEADKKSSVLPNKSSVSSAETNTLPTEQVTAETAPAPQPAAAATQETRDDVRNQEREEDGQQGREFARSENVRQGQAQAEGQEITPDGVAATPAAPKKQGVARLADLLRSSNKLDAKPEQYEDVRLTGLEGEAIERLAALFGKNVVVFRPKADAPWKAGGALFPSDPSTLFINADSGAPATYVFMHELVHSMKRTDPETWAKLEAAMRPLLKNKERYQKGRLGGKALPEAIVTEEMIADMMAENAMNPQFWSDLYGRFGDKSAWAQFVSFMRSFLSRAIDTLYTIGPNNYVSDLSKAYEALVDAAYNHARAQHGDVASNGKAMELPAYHGTPHEVGDEGFSLSKIGSGEGAQAYGWGLYFAEDQGIAESYRKVLSYKKIVSDFRRALPDDGDFDEVMSLVGTGHFTPYQDRVLTALQADGWLGFDYPSQAISAAYRSIDDFDPSQELRDAIAATGNLYTVDIPDSAASKMLDWDKPLSEQPEAVRAALDKVERERLQKAVDDRKSRREILASKNEDTGPIDRAISVLQEELDGPQLALGGTGERYYKSLAQKLGSDRAASEYLIGVGIPGIRYLDAGSRNAGDGSRNLVVFDDKLVRITHKNGRPVTKSEREAFIDEMRPQDGAALELPSGPAILSSAQGSPPSQSLLDEGNAYWRAGAKMWDNLNRVRILQDKAVQRGLQMRDNMNVWVRENLSRSKMRVMADKVTEDYQQPILDLMAANDLSLRQVDDYLYALHAPERNAAIAAINPRFPDGGSGMTNAEAASILAAFTPEQTNVLKQIAAKTKALQDYKLSVMEKYGLMEPADVARLRSMYSNYVPLKTIDEGDTTPGQTGRGLDIRGSEVKQALGRGSRATSPLLVSFQDMARTLVRAHKNEAGNALLELSRDPVIAGMQQNGKPIIAIADPQEFARPVTDAQGNVITAIPGNWWQNEEIFVTKENGVPRYIHVRDPELMAQLRRMGDAELGAALRTIGQGTRLFARMLTQYNPVFAPVNVVRDAIQASVLALGVKGLNPLKVLAAIPANLGRIMANKARPNQRYKEFLEDGASTNAYGLNDLQDSIADIEALGISLGYTRPANNGWDKAWNAINAKRKAVARKRAVRTVFDGLSWWNEAFENAVRLSTYNAMRDAGYTREEAAFQSKELSTNFNKKGQLSAALNAAYVFVNAAMQGNRALVKFWKESPKIRAAFIGLVAAGVLQDVLGSLFGGEDDESGLANLDEVGDWALDHNIVIPTGDNEQVKIPIPYGLNLPFVMGRRVSRAIRTGEGMSQIAGILNVALDNFSPIGGFEPVSDRDGSVNVSGTVAKTISPSLLRPLVGVAFNANFMGAPIAKEPFQGDPSPAPRAYDFKPGTADYAVKLAEWLNSASGGNKAKPGDINVSPEHIQYLIGEYSGGAGRFVSDVTDISSKLARGAEGDIDWAKAPFVRSFTGVDSRSDAYARYREIRQGVSYLKDEKEARLPLDPAYVGVRRLVERTEDRLSDLRKRRKAAYAREDMAMVRQIQEQETTLIKAVVKQFNEQQKAPAN